MSHFLAGTVLGEAQVSLFVAGAVLGEAQVSHFVQAQYLVKLKCHFSWQAQYCKFLSDVGRSFYVAGAVFGEFGG